MHHFQGVHLQKREALQGHPNKFNPAGLGGGFCQSPMVSGTFTPVPFLDLVLGSHDYEGKIGSGKKSIGSMT